MPQKRKLESNNNKNQSISQNSTPKWFDADDGPDPKAKELEIGDELERSDKNTKKREKFDWASSFEKEEDDDIFERSVMHQSKSLIDNTKSTSILNIKRVTDVNFTSPSKLPITTIKFHGNGNLIATGGLDQFLKIFRIDTNRSSSSSSSSSFNHNNSTVNTNNNQAELQFSMKLSNYPIRKALFVGNESEAVVGGRKPYFYVCDISTGVVTKCVDLSKRKQIKSHESFCSNPSGTLLAFGGRGGLVHVVDGKHKTWCMDIKMNSGCRSMSFIDDKTLITSGVDSKLYIWDLRYNGSNCLGQLNNADGTPCSCISVSSPLMISNANSNRTGIENDYMNTYKVAVGYESGVTDLLNLDLSRLNNDNDNDSIVNSNSCESQRKSFMNLTTKITNIAFHPSNEIVAVSSNQRKDQVRVIHTPTLKTFSNWPTIKSPVKHLQEVDFSSDGRYLAIANSAGRVLLYNVRGYES